MNSDKKLSEIVLHYNFKDNRYYLYYGGDYVWDSESFERITQIFTRLRYHLKSGKIFGKELLEVVTS